MVTDCTEKAFKQNWHDKRPGLGEQDAAFCKKLNVHARREHARRETPLPNINTAASRVPSHRASV
jgi:hypothetical protein